MIAIENTTPQDLLQEAAAQLINERKHAAVTEIKEILKRIAQLTNDIKTMSQAVDKKQKELDGVSGRLDRIRSGDWNVLQGMKEKNEPLKETEIA